MFEFNILTTLILLPLIGAIFIWLFISNDSKTSDNNAKSTALWTTIVTFLLSLWLLVKFDKEAVGFQFTESAKWIGGDNINYLLGIDGISIFMVILTTFLMPICILTSWKSTTMRVREFMLSFLILESFIIGVFCALDAIMFYIFFEGMLIPMFLIIGIWGGNKRVYASYKFFLYTLAGSVFFLIAILYMYSEFGTTNIEELAKLGGTLSFGVQKLLWLAMFASFAVKVPMWPVHTWLPDAHVQAPTAGSVILAGVLLKMGAYGFLRFSLPMLPDASVYFAPLIYGLSIVAIIYTSLVALVQEDMKKLIAYSSIAHMGFITIGIFSFNIQGVEGAIMQMISHGIVAAALFLCVGVIYDRIHTREISRYGGLVKNMPRYALVFLIFTFASVGLPATSGFVGEFLVLIGAFKVSPILALFASTGMVLGASYALLLFRRVMFGELEKKELLKISDINIREKIILFPLAALAILFGIYPALIFNIINVSVEQLLYNF